jgi:thiosulfate/3-mercaptopyruvate sulfurtransferase
VTADNALEPSPPFVSVDWLADHIDDPSVRIIDVRWKSRYENGKGISLDDPEGYRAGHIPGAVFAGMVADLSDLAHAVPDMLAPSERFADAMSRLGVGENMLVVAYDNMGVPLGSARLWWALSYYGHDHVRVLDGGLKEWIASGKPISTVVHEQTPTRFVARPRPGWLATKAEVLASLSDRSEVLIDCLNAELFEGGGDRHLWGQRPGHIPGALNVPYLANIDPLLATATAAEREQLLASGRSFKFASPEALRQLYSMAGIKPDDRVITYCGRGYAGACGLLALRSIGFTNVRLYDGSWCEWSADMSLPVETGPARPRGKVQ